MYKPPYLYAEEEYQLSITRKERQQEVQQLIKEEVVIPIKASALLRSNKRKPKETFEAYRRGVANASKALKVRLKYGLVIPVDAEGKPEKDRSLWVEPQIYINRLTMEVL